MRVVGWRLEIHTPGEEQRGQQRAHTEKILEDRHWLIRSLANAIGICINAVDWQAVQSERIIAPYRMQRPLTRRKPAAHACRTVVLRLHTPLTRCIPGPHASRTGMTMSSSCWMDATGMACVDEARPKKKRIGMSFLIVLLPRSRLGSSLSNHLKSIEPDVPLSKRLVHISDRLTPI